MRTNEKMGEGRMKIRREKLRPTLRDRVERVG